MRAGTGARIAALVKTGSPDGAHSVVVQATPLDAGALAVVTRPATSTTISTKTSASIWR